MRGKRATTEQTIAVLTEAAVQRNQTIGQLIDESLEFYGIKSRDDASELVRRARARSKLSGEQALAAAQKQMRAVRRGS